MLRCSPIASVQCCANLDEKDFVDLFGRHLSPTALVGSLRPKEILATGLKGISSSLLMHFHRRSHASHQSDAIRHLIDADAHRHALRKPDPGEDRIYRGEPRLIRLRVRDVNAMSDAPDMTTNELAVTHQLDGRQVALMDPAETKLKV